MSVTAVVAVGIAGITGVTGIAGIAGTAGIAGVTGVAALAGLAGLAAVVGPARRRHRVRARLASGRVSTPLGVRGVPGVPTPVVAVGVVGVVSAYVAAGPVALVVAACVLGTGPLRRRIGRGAALRRRRHHQLPLALDGLAAALRSGASLVTALGDVGGAVDPPLGDELTAIARAAERGRPLDPVLATWSTAHDDPGTRLAATAMSLADRLGSAPARALDGVAATLRERLDLAAERRALSVQARTSALVLSLAPLAFVAVAVVGDTAAADFLTGTPAGWGCLAVGTALDAGGAWWMSRLSRTDGW